MRRVSTFVAAVTLLTCFVVPAVAQTSPDDPAWAAIEGGRYVCEQGSSEARDTYTYEVRDHVLHGEWYGRTGDGWRTLATPTMQAVSIRGNVVAFAEGNRRYYVSPETLIVDFLGVCTRS